MHLDTEDIATLVDRVASLDDAPDRARHHWFYVDLARVTAEWCEEAAAYSEDNGYEDGWSDGHTAARVTRDTGTHSATRRQLRSRRHHAETDDRDRARGDGGGIA